MGQLDEMPYSELLEWMEFAEIEPFGLPVQDVIQANALALHANMRRDVKKYPEPFPIKNFQLFAQKQEQKPKVEPLVDGLTAEQWRQRIALEMITAARNKAN